MYAGRQDGFREWLSPDGVVGVSAVAPEEDANRGTPARIARPSAPSSQCLASTARQGM